MRRAVRALYASWARWDVVLWSLSEGKSVGPLGTFPAEWMACLRIRFWLARRASVRHTLPIVMRRES